MKKLLWVSAGMLMIFNTACKSSGDDVVAEKNLLIGKWKPESIKATTPLLPVPMDVPLTDCDKKNIIWVKDNSQGIGEVYTMVNNACTKTGEDTFTYTYNKTSQILKIKYQNNTQKMTVTELTDNLLKAKQDTIVNGTSVNLQLVFVKTN